MSAWVLGGNSYGSTMSVCEQSERVVWNEGGAKSRSRSCVGGQASFPGHSDRSGCSVFEWACLIPSKRAGCCMRDIRSEGLWGAAGVRCL